MRRGSANFKRISPADRAGTRTSASPVGKRNTPSRELAWTPTIQPYMGIHMKTTLNIDETVMASSGARRRVRGERCRNWSRPLAQSLSGQQKPAACLLSNFASGGSLSTLATGTLYSMEGR